MGKYEKKYNVNNDYFGKINTPEKSYILGFIYADGCNYISDDKKNFIINFTQLKKSIDILQKINFELNSEYPIREYNQKENNKIICTLDIRSKKMSEDLIKLGVTPKKSLFIKFPNNNIVPEELVSHFIRGYFDGDGCITIKSTGYVSISICCNSRMFLESVQSYLIQQNIFSRPITTEHRAKHPLYVLYITKRKDQNAFKNLIYRNSTIFLKRKYNKFLQIPR